MRALNRPVEAILPGGIATLFGIAFSLGAVLIAIAAYLLIGHELAVSTDRSLQQHASRLIPAGADRASGTAVAQRIAAARAGRGMSEVGYRLLDPAGRVLAGTIGAVDVAPGLSDAIYADGPSRPHDGRALRIDLGDGSQLILVKEGEAAEEVSKTIWLVFAITLAVALIGGLAISLGLGHAIASRLSAIRATADAIVAGDHGRRVPVDRLGGMFADQADSFNRMLDRVEGLMANVKQVSSDVAHDLRTPLTRLRATLANAGRADIDDNRRRMLLAGAEQECDALLTLFSALLRISEVEDGRRRSHIRDIDLDAMVEEIVESMEPVFADAGQEVSCRVAGATKVRADPDLLTQLVVNLLENAHHHTPAGTSVLVEVTADESNVTLIVRDDGPGIPEIDRTRVLRRFVRLERSRNTPGNGLGLALARAIVGLHDGRLQLDDAGPGLVVRVTLSASISARTDRVTPILSAAETLRDTSTAPTWRRTATRRRTRY